ncbi:hypothetical protein WJX84_005236 [Apatococcus fuscideae]|uniref:Uncharacterized protein n=1 Tax=Apatococcus fuscideae TaxID=2026836 RepID=A0AAW1SYT7_9CHLO
MRTAHTAPYGESWGKSFAPDPGAYFHDSTLLWNDGCLSKKGFGTLVSQSKKGLLTPRYEGPGPGAYNARQEILTAKRRSFSTADSSQKVEDYPGPGAYSPGTHWPSDNDVECCESGAVAAFRGSSRSSHPTVWGISRSPGVGTYDQASENHHTRAVPFQGSSNSSRTTNSAKDKVPVSLTDEDQRRIRRLHGRLAWQAGSQRTASQRPFNETPARQQVFSHTRAALHDIPTEQDRFGRPLHPRVHQASLPGPGSYNVPGSLRLSAASQAAPFNVCERRPDISKARKVDAPGPAFYKSSAQRQHASHHTSLCLPGVFLI